MDKNLKKNPTKANAYVLNIKDNVNQSHARKLEENEVEDPSASHVNYLITMYMADTFCGIS